jgi:hypothetical protein
MRVIGIGWGWDGGWRWGREHTILLMARFVLIDHPGFEKIEKLL